MFHLIYTYPNKVILTYTTPFTLFKQNIEDLPSFFFTKTKRYSFIEIDRVHYSTPLKT